MKTYSLDREFFLFKFFRFLYGSARDSRDRAKVKSFNEFGITLFCGRQGDGKTVSMVHCLELYRHKYPKALIYTNFGYKYQTGALTNWNQILTLKNGTDGIIFAIDEIQNEFDVYAARGFDVSILRLITQQRKQAIKILGTAQVFTRVTKPLREQTFDVVECRTFGGRWTFQKAFDAFEYSNVVDSMVGKDKLRRLSRRNFVQTDELRSLFDSYAVIQSLQKISI